MNKIKMFAEIYNINFKKVSYRNEKNEMPIGFGMALAINPAAMEKFASIPQNEKQKIIDGTHHVSSKSEMQQYVKNIISTF